MKKSFDNTAHPFRSENAARLYRFAGFPVDVEEVCDLLVDGAGLSHPAVVGGPALANHQLSSHFF